MPIGRNKSLALVGIDGVGQDSKLHKAMNYSLSVFPFFDDVVLFSCDDSDGCIPIDPMSSTECQKFTIIELNEYIYTDYILIVQGDGFIANPHLWHDEFLDYDYIGAPWCFPWRVGDPHLLYAESENLECKNVVGNGGFSLRSKRFLDESSKLEYDGYSPEDAFVCIKKYDELCNNGIRFAPAEVACKFSTDPYNGNTFGFHGGGLVLQ